MDGNKLSNKYGLTSSRFAGNDMSERAKEVTDKAKRKHRTDLKLKDWDRYKFYKNDFCEQMIKNPPKGMFSIPYEDGDKLSLEEFRNKYESKALPVVIRGLTKSWKANKYWTFEVKVE